MYWQLQLPRNHMEISFSSYSLRCSFLAWTTKGKGRAWERTAAESTRTCRVKQVLCPLELRLRCVRSSVWLLVGVDLLWENITVDWLVAGGWCWFSMRKQYYWLIGWQAKRKHPKILYQKISHRMFGHIHGVLNVDKRKKTIAQSRVNCETNLLNLIVSWFDNVVLQ